MKFRLGSVGLMTLLGLCAPASSAQLVREMTPERIQEALAAGTAEPDREHCYPMQFAPWPSHACVTTPWSRVAGFAAAAPQPVGLGDVPPGAIAPMIEVVANAFVQNGRVCSVKRVLVSRDGAQAIRPADVKLSSQSFRDRSGALWEGTAAVARFPLQVLDAPDAEVHVAYSNCKERKTRFPADIR